MAFLRPYALVFAGLVGVLVAFYLRDRYRPRIEVPSLLLWKHVPTVSLSTSRFRPDLLFLLQLSLLSLLVLGLADPYLTGPVSRSGRARYVFVLDTSASMQAREGRQTRFDAARDALRLRLETLRPQDEAMLMTAAQSPSVLSGFTRDHAALADQVAQLEPLDTGTNLELALAAAARALTPADERSRIEVFTDRVHPGSLPSDWRGRVAVRQFGKTDDNVAIERLDIFQGQFQGPLEARARLVVRNFSDQEKHGSLVINIEDELIERRGFSLPEHGARTFSFTRFPSAGLLLARIDVDDALPIDNQTYGWIRPERPISLLLVSASEKLKAELERIGAATASLRLVLATPEQDRGGTAAGADIQIFDHEVPEIAPPAAALYIFPERGSGWLASSGVAERVEILDWNERHPVLGGLRPELPFPLQRAQQIALPGWAEPLLMTRQNGREFPLAFCGEHDGRRVVVMTFDLGAEGLLHSDHVNLLLFFLNVLEWLAPADEEVRVVHTGESVLLPDPPGRAARLTDPRGRTVILDDPGSVRVEASLAGEYRIGTEARSRRLYANLMDARESDIGRQAVDVRGGAEAQAEAEAEADAGGDAEAATVSPSPDAGFGRWLYALAAGLLLVEWALAARRA